MTVLTMSLPQLRPFQRSVDGAGGRIYHQEAIELGLKTLIVFIVLLAVLAPSAILFFVPITKELSFAVVSIIFVLLSFAVISSGLPIFLTSLGVFVAYLAIQIGIISNLMRD